MVTVPIVYLKIEKEKTKSVPERGLIKYWEREIIVYTEEIEKANKRLKRGRKEMSVASIKISSTLMTLLNELRDECLSCIKLIHHLFEHLTDDQIDDVLGELTASVTHLQIHSAIVKEELEKD